MWSKKIKFILGGLLLMLMVLVLSNQALALPTEYTLEVPIGSDPTVSGVAEYIDLIYKFLVGIAGIVATIMIMFGGWQWIFAAGNDSTITAAKERITSAIIGLVLALASYLILFTINPALVQLIQLSPSEISPLSGCSESEEYKLSAGERCTKSCQCRKLEALDLNGKNIAMQCTYLGMENDIQSVGTSTSSETKTCGVPDGNLCAFLVIENGEKKSSGHTYSCVTGSKCVNAEADNISTGSGDTWDATFKWYCRETTTTSSWYREDGIEYCLLSYVRLSDRCSDVRSLLSN